MAEMEKKLMHDEEAQANGTEIDVNSSTIAIHGQRHDRDHSHETYSTLSPNEISKGEEPGTTEAITIPIRTKLEKISTRYTAKQAPLPKQRLGQCERCGYLSSQAVCKACVLLEGLNKARPRTGIEVGNGG